MVNKYPERKEMIEYLKKHYPTKNTKSIKKYFEEKYNLKISEDYICGLAYENGIKKDSGYASSKWSKIRVEVEETLKEKYHNTRNTDLAEEVSKKFNVNFPSGTIRKWGKKLGLKKSIGFAIGGSTISWEGDRKEIEKFIKENFMGMTNRDIKDFLDERYNTSVGIASIRKIAKKFGLQKQTYQNYPKLTREQISWLKKKYVDTSLIKEDLLEKFNKKFGYDYSLNKLAEEMGKKKILKSDKGKKKSHKAAGLKHKKYTKDVISFIRKCAKEGKSSIETKNACQLEFEMPFNTGSLRKNAFDMKIKFNPLIVAKIDPIFENPKMLEVVKKCIRQNPKEDYQDIFIRDAIIEEFEKNVHPRDIKIFCQRNEIEINCIGRTHQEGLEKAREYNKKKKRNFRDYEEELY